MKADGSVTISLIRQSLPPNDRSFRGPHEEIDAPQLPFLVKRQTHTKTDKGAASDPVEPR
jgi:hypothetical protein